MKHSTHSGVIDQSGSLKFDMSGWPQNAAVCAAEAGGSSLEVLVGGLERVLSFCGGLWPGPNSAVDSRASGKSAPGDAPDPRSQMAAFCIQFGLGVFNLALSQVPGLSNRC